MLSVSAYFCVALLVLLLLAGYMEVDLELAVRNFFRRALSLATSKKHAEKYSV
jgi:hypothetical protein